VFFPGELIISEVEELGRVVVWLLPRFAVFELVVIGVLYQNCRDINVVILRNILRFVKYWFMLIEFCV